MDGRAAAALQDVEHPQGAYGDDLHAAVRLIVQVHRHVGRHGGDVDLAAGQPRHQLGIVGIDAELVAAEAEPGAAAVDIVQQLGRAHAGGAGQHRQADIGLLVIGRAGGFGRFGGRLLRGFHGGLHRLRRLLAGRVRGIGGRGFAGGAQREQQGGAQGQRQTFHVLHGEIPFLYVSYKTFSSCLRRRMRMVLPSRAMVPALSMELKAR